MSKTAEEIQRGLQAPIPPELVKFKPGSVSGGKAMAIAYIDARTVMDRLDEVLGIDGWQDHYEAMEGGMVKCRISIRIGSEWVSREDAGRESAQPDKGDRGKSAFSDSFKRCAVKLGIGRELYGMKAQWVDYDPQKKRFVGTPRVPVAARRSTLGVSPAPASRPETLSNGHAPAPQAAPPAPAAEPEKVLTVGEWVWKQSGKAKKAGIGLEGDELADHVLEELKKDWGSDMHQWPDDAMPDAKAAAQDFAMRAKRCKGDPFRKARPEELQPLTEAVAAPGGVTWGEVVKAMDWPADAVPSGLSLENLRDALDFLAEKAGAAKDRAKAKQQLAGSR